MTTSLSIPALLAICAVLVGVSIRVVMYVQHVSLWFDEILVAFNAATRTGLDMDVLHSTPPLYLLLERACVHLFGVNEAALRLPSFVAGLAIVLLVAATAARLTSSYYGTAAATLFAALSPNLCRYANELKPYSLDAAIAATLVALTVWILIDGPSRVRLTALTAAGLVSVLLSTSCVFVFLGVIAALCCRGFWRSYRLWLVSTALAWGGTFAFLYQRLYAPAGRSDFMLRFWAGARFHFTGIPDLAGAVAGALSAPALAMDAGTPLLAIEGVVLVLPGIWALYKRLGIAGPLLFLTPLLAAIGAAILGKWYLVVRLLLFTAPLMCVLFGLGVSQLAQWSRRLAPLVYATLLVLALALPAKYVFWRVRHTELQSNRTLVQGCIRQARPGDVVYIYPRSTAAWAFYSTRWTLPAPEDTERMVAVIDSSGPNAGNVPSRNHPVIHEGYSWRFDRSGRIELFGVPTGIQSTSAGYAGTADPGWEDNEIDRMLAEAQAGRRFWLVASEYQPQALRSLLDRLTERGFSSQVAYQGLGVILYRLIPPTHTVHDG